MDFVSVLAGITNYFDLGRNRDDPRAMEKPPSFRVSEWSTTVGREISDKAQREEARITFCPKCGGMSKGTGLCSSCGARLNVSPPQTSAADGTATAPGLGQKSKKSKTKPMIAPKQFYGQWIALFAGVLIQPFFQTYQVTRHWSFDGITGWALFALITSLLIFPAVYRNTFDVDKPMVIQLAPIFAAGLGWQSLLTTAIKAASR